MAQPAKNVFRKNVDMKALLRRNMRFGSLALIQIVAMMAAFPIYLHFLGYEKYGVWLVLAPGFVLVQG